MKINKHYIVLLLLFSLSMLSWGGNGKTPQKPNIIFYLTDDQDKLDYGCYGNDKIITPSVDQLAKEGVLFQNAFTGQAICAPSRSQLYTGNYPLKNGCFMNHTPTTDDQISTTTYMQELGYDVILAGKSHVIPSSVFDWSHVFKPVKVEGIPRPYIPYENIEHYFKTADKPFCMYITSEFPHGPYIDVEPKSAENYIFYPFNESSRGSDQSLKQKAGYYRNVQEDDVQLAKILAWVDKYLDENTLFIYSADHGITGKFTVYDRGLNVPFIARWPKVIKPNSTSDVMIHYTDVLPTFMEMAGGKTPDAMDGKSFLKVLTGDEEEIHDYVYGVSTNQNINNTSVFPSRMIRSKRYKYIRNYNSIEVVDKNLGDNEYINAFLKRSAEKYKDTPFEELFDIENDPFEQVNLAKAPAYKAIKQELVKGLAAWMNEQGDILVKENYMPLLKPSNNHLDRSSKHKKVPAELENTLKPEDYLQLHY